MYQLKCQVQKCGKVQLSLFAFDFTKTSSVLPTDRRKSHVRTYGREIDASHIADAALHVPRAKLLPPQPLLLQVMA